MRTVVLAIMVAMLAGCASTHRIEPLVDMKTDGPVTVVFKEHIAPLGASINNPGVGVAVGMQFGFVGGFVGGVVEGMLGQGWLKEATRAIAVLREQLPAGEMNRLFVSTIASTRTARGNAIPVVERVHGEKLGSKTKHRDDKNLLAQSGVTVVLTPTVTMSPEAEALVVIFSATGYVSANGRRVYQSTFVCESRLGTPLGTERNVAAWEREDGRVLKEEFAACASGLSELAVADLYEEERFDWNSVEARRAAKSPVAEVPLGEFAEFQLYGLQKQGFLLKRIRNEHPVLLKLEDEWVEIDEHELAARLLSVDSAQIPIIVDEAKVFGLLSERLLDAAATRLWLLRQTKDHHEYAAATGLVDLLVTAGNPRYRDMLLSVARDSQREDLRRWAASAARRLSEEGTEQFRVAEGM